VGTGRMEARKAVCFTGWNWAQAQARHMVVRHRCGDRRARAECDRPRIIFLSDNEKAAHHAISENCGDRDAMCALSYSNPHKHAMPKTRVGSTGTHTTARLKKKVRIRATPTTPHHNTMHENETLETHIIGLRAAAASRLKTTREKETLHASHLTSTQHTSRTREAESE